MNAASRDISRRVALALIAAAAVTLGACSGPAPSQSTAPAAAAAPAPAAAPARFKAAIAYDDARGAFAVNREILPADLKAKAPAELEAFWAAWVVGHDAAIRARLERGDEESIVNLWQFGTSFTTLPRISERQLGTASTADVQNLVIDRLDDFVRALAAPGGNDRLTFARQVIERHHIDVTQPAGQDAARAYLVEVRSRGIAEHERYRNTLAKTRLGTTTALDVFATLYRDRGLSSDTSLTIGFALDQSIAAAVAKRMLTPGAVRRLAIVGPGLDFTNKAEGYDFYPQQTIQPFALIDSLARTGAATLPSLQVVTLDLSPRVNHHLVSARARAQQGQPYVLQLPLDRDWPGHKWQPAFINYWQAMGSRIGSEVSPILPPSDALALQMRAVAIRPDVPTAITARDLNIVLERLDPLAPDDRFDLIVATNILVYYDAFEQRLALLNIANMLKPGGYFVTNYRISPLAPMEPAPGLDSTVTWDDRRNGDSVFWYRRR